MNERIIYKFSLDYEDERADKKGEEGFFESCIDKYNNKKPHQ